MTRRRKIGIGIFIVLALGAMGFTLTNPERPAGCGGCGEKASVPEQQNSPDGEHYFGGPEEIKEN